MDLAIINRPRVLPCRLGYRIGKRLMDLAVCLIALPVVVPLLAVCALAIWLDSPGPVIFSQDRVGKGGRYFRMYKLRTMQNGLDYSSHRVFMKRFVRGQAGNNRHPTGHQALAKPFVDRHLGPAGDEQTIHKPVKPWQTTRVGRFLRKTSLDELPQIFNVLKGEMSLVGPRPNVQCEVEECQPWHFERMEVLPGITGLAQIRGRSSISFDRIVRYDIEYVERQSVALDAKILLETFFLVLANKGAR